MDIVDQVLQQAPIHVTYEDAKRAVELSGGDVVKALEHIYAIEKVEKPKTEWDNVRENAAAFSEAMEKVLKGSKSQQSIDHPSR